MMGNKYIKDLGFKTIEEVYDYIVETDTKGNKIEARMLVQKLSFPQFMKFVYHVRDNMGLNKNDVQDKLIRFTLMRADPDRAMRAAEQVPAGLGRGWHKHSHDHSLAAREGKSGARIITFKDMMRNKAKLNAGEYRRKYISVEQYIQEYNDLILRETWKMVRTIDNRIYEFESKRGLSLKVKRAPGEKYWAVSILGKGRTQPEYLAGGNSTKQTASRSQAFELAKAFMLLNY